MCTVSRLVESKGIDLLIKTTILLNKTSNIRLLIIGDGPDKNRLEELIKRNNAEAYIDMIGYQVNPHKFVARSDAFVFGSFSEGLPTVLVDSMICKTPIITTFFKGSIEDVIVKGKTGIIVYKRSEEEMAKAIISLLNDKDKREKITQHALLFAKRKFSKEKYISKYKKLFDELIS